MGNTKKPRLLYLHSSAVPPPADPKTDRFVLLSNDLRGEVLHPLWFHSGEECEARVGPGTFPFWQRGSFRYHWCLWTCSGLRLRLRTFWFYIREGLRLHREERIDCIMTYAHMTTALCGVILSWLTGAKLVVEIVAAPELAYRYEEPTYGLTARLMKLYSEFCLHITMWSCDRVHLLYPWQLDHYPLLKNTPKSSFVEFVPIQGVPRLAPSDPPFILLVGAPWFRKGVDLLIAAFLRLTSDFPDVRLKILGHFPDRAYLESLAQGCSRIEILPPTRTNAEAHQIIASASIFALPSRCEGTARVILEAMAAGVPVVSSDVAGAAVMIRHGENGLLFPTCDISALEQHLRTLLSDPDMRSRFGQRGYEIAQTEFGEDSYRRDFVKMIHDTVDAP